MFLQVHFLTSYHATLLNRDDAGLAKRINFGGVPRLRVSSQCQKRHWREWMTDGTDLPNAIRSREFFSREIKNRLLDAGMEAETAHELIRHLAGKLLVAGAGRDALDKDTLKMKQPVLFGKPEADYLSQLIQEAGRETDVNQAKLFLDERIKKGRSNFKAMLRESGIEDPVVGFEGALFGRFVTSDVLARTDAPVHVAHALTTHAVETEVDFFTVVDDLASDEETGAAHAGDMELGVGIFYGYVAVDTPLLVSNLTGCKREEWRERDPSSTRALLRLLIQAISEVSPGAKLGATAPYARAECVVLEIGKSQPRSLANAFLAPVRPGSIGTNPMAQSVASLAGYVDALEGMYGDTGEQRLVSSVHPWSRTCEQVMSLPEITSQGLEQLFLETQ